MPPPLRDMTRCIGQCYSIYWYICLLCHWPIPFHTMHLEQYKCDLIKDFPPYPRMGNDRVYLCDVGSRPYRIQELKRPTLCRWRIRTVAGRAGFHRGRLVNPPRPEKKSLLSAFGLDALVLFKRKKMAILFLFLHASGGGVTDYQYVR